jgi:ubiquinone/menaquinone biosynthesis C-methylase UbiE
MTTAAALAPGVPPDYYDRIFEAEQRHWWYRGMRSISAALLGERLQAGGRVLDAGCGTGGFLRWVLDEGPFSSAAGVDIGSAAIDLARRRVPEAELRVSALRELPFADGSFDLVVSGDVLQHVPEDEVARSLGEVRRVLAPGGALLLRTNGARRLRRERADWRAYDVATLASALRAAGLSCERLTYANSLLSLWAVATRRTPHAPTDERHGIPLEAAPRLRSAIGLRVLEAEARYLARPGRRLPYGHTLFALAVRVA